MIDDEVGAHTKVTVLAYWKFESVSLQRRVTNEPFGCVSPVKLLRIRQAGRNWGPPPS
jgi:hypothetical protein